MWCGARFSKTLTDYPTPSFHFAYLLFPSSVLGLRACKDMLHVKNRPRICASAPWCLRVWMSGGRRESRSRIGSVADATAYIALMCLLLKLRDYGVILFTCKGTTKRGTSNNLFYPYVYPDIKSLFVCSILFCIRTPSVHLLLELL